MTIQTLSQLFTVCRLSDLSGCPIYPVSTFRSRSSFLPWQTENYRWSVRRSVFLPLPWSVRTDGAPFASPDSLIFLWSALFRRLRRCSLPGRSACSSFLRSRQTTCWSSKSIRKRRFPCCPMRDMTSNGNPSGSRRAEVPAQRHCSHSASSFRSFCRSILHAAC
jgi:hypothetical protein